MNTLYLGYKTAQWYWERVRDSSVVRGSRATRSSASRCVSSATEVRSIVAGTIFGEQPIDAIVSKRGCRDARGVSFHCCQSQLPQRAFVQLKGGLYIASPELSFIQAATHLSFGQLLKYGFALCGCHALCESDPSGTTYREPLTTVKRLTEFVAQCHDIAGLTQARKALPFILDNSRSPRESTVAIILTLPKRLGGYALPRPALNVRLNIPATLRSFTDRSSFVIDFFWEGANIAAEYDSDAEHLEPERQCADAIKRNVLSLWGYRPFGITTIQIDSARETDKTADALRRHLGTKRREKLPRNHEERKQKLREELGLGRG